VFSFLVIDDLLPSIVLCWNQKYDAGPPPPGPALKVNPTIGPFNRTARSLTFPLVKR
jgi:hypothetical protein